MRSGFIKITAMACGLVLLSLIFLPPNSRRETKKVFHERETEALEALQWLTKSRAFPNLDIPADAYAKAWEYYRQQYAPQNTRMPAFPGTWTSIGPNNMGGRTLCIGVNPADTSEVWLGSASGGLWKSTSGGIGVSAWTKVNTGFPILGVSSITFHPTNPDIMFIGTGETYSYGTSTNGLTDRTTRGTHGMGVLKTTDGGATWSYALNWSYQQNRGIWEVVINPLNPNVVFAATTEGVYRSNDMGTTWSQVLGEKMVTDLVILKTDTNVLLAGVGNLNSINKGLYRTTNGGQNWSIVNNGLPANTHDGRITISMWEPNNNYGVLQICNAFNTIGIYTTSDAGQSWTVKSTQDLNSYQGWYSEGMLIHPNDSNKIIVTGIDANLSLDGGLSFFQASSMSGFTNYCHVDMHDVVVNPLDPEKIYIAHDGGMNRSNDFGTTFYDCNDGYVTTQFYIGSVSATNPDLALGGLQDNFTNQYQGAGNYWSLGHLGGDGSYNAIDPTDDNIQYASYQYRNIFQSFDQGQTFFGIYSSPASAFGNNPAAFLAPFVIAPSNTSVIYHGGLDLKKSTDQGGSFSVVGNPAFDPDGNVILSIAVSHTNPDTVYVATAPDFGPMKVFRSDNGGGTFTSITGTLPNRFPRRIAVNPQNSSEVYIVFSGFGTGHVFKSTNAGATWTDISTTLPDVPFHAVVVDPQFPNVIYAGSDLGIFVSVDGGQSWTTYNTGLSDMTMAFDFAICPADRSMLLFTHGYGVYRRSLNDVVGLSEQTAASLRFDVYPNPATDRVTLAFEDGPAHLTVYDLNGKKLSDEKLAAGTHSIELKNWANGTYVFVLDRGGKRVVKRVVKK